MLKKIISYLIIFSILYSDAADCGNGWGREGTYPVDDEGDIPSTSARRQTTDNTERRGNEPETTPLASSKRWTIDAADIPHLSQGFNFERFAETSQGQSLPLWHQGRDEGEERSETSATETYSLPQENHRTLEKKELTLSEHDIFDSSDAPNDPVNATFETLKKAGSKRNLSQWMRASRGESQSCESSSNEEEERLRDKGLVLLEDDGDAEDSQLHLEKNSSSHGSLALESGNEGENTEEAAQPAEQPDYTTRWRKEPSPRSSYESEPESGRSLRAFFTELLSKAPQDEKEPLLEGQQASGLQTLPRTSLKRGSQFLIVNQDESDQELTSAQELGDIIIVSRDFSEMSLDEFSDLSPEAQAFLRYVKKRIIDGELNWKQKLGIVGGVVMGAGVAWPWMCILFYSLLELYANYVANSVDVDNVYPEDLNKKFEAFNRYINLKSMIPLVGIPLGTAAASQMAAVFMSWGQDDMSAFSIQRSKKHWWALVGSKGTSYFLALFGGLPAVYYLYSSLVDSQLQKSFSFQVNNTTDFWYEYCLKNDIFLNITMNISHIGDNCSTTTPSLSNNFPLFNIGAPFLFLSMVLWQGHRLSQRATQWLDKYFFGQVKKSGDLNLENLQQAYLSQFETLMKHVKKSDEEKLNQFSFNTHNKGPNEDRERFTLQGTLNFIKSLKNFEISSTILLEDDDSEQWKKTWASRLGWAIPEIATFGRMMVFMYVIESLFVAFGLSQWNQDDIGEYFSYIIGWGLAHLSKGLMEREAVEEGICDILGNRNSNNKRTPAALRVSLNVMDYVFGAFQTVPYLLTGLAAPYGFNLNVKKIESLVSDAPHHFFLLSFGIADAFINAVNFRCFRHILVNSVDYIKSLDGKDKKNNMRQVIFQMHQIFKSLDPNVLKEIDQYLQRARENNLETETQILSSVNRVDEETIETSHRPLYNKQKLDEWLSHNGTVVVSQLTGEIKAFLRYLKVRIIDEELNGKQKAGIAGGLITGMAIVWPMMLIIFDGLLTPYFNYILPKSDVQSTYPPYQLFDFFNKFNSFINQFTLLSIIGIPMAIDAASRTASIFIDLTKDDTKLFSLQKGKNHEQTLQVVKASLWFSVFCAGFLPVYYLFESILGCTKMNRSYEGYLNCSAPDCPEIPIPFTVYLSTDIYFNITTHINSTKYNVSHCGNYITRFDLPVENIALFFVGGPFLLLDIVLQYGHQISSHIEKWINNYFFTQMRKSSQFSFAETLRRKYVDHFKFLMNSLQNADKTTIDNLYNQIFPKILNLQRIPQSTGLISSASTGTRNDSQEEPTHSRADSIHACSIKILMQQTSPQKMGILDIEKEEHTLTEAIRILKILNTQTSNDSPTEQQNPLEEKKAAHWKKTFSLHLGRAIPFIATFGRMVIFDHLIEELFKAFYFEGVSAQILSAIFGGIFANISQGFIEKDAAQKAIYEILLGKKASEECSHHSLRIGIKIWDYVYGAFHTLPYLVAGSDATNGPGLINDQGWQYFFLVTFGLADAFNNAIAFHESNLAVVNAYDSLKATYGTPSPEYKRDKLVRTVHQIRQLFKELDHPVLEQVDWLLNQEAVNQDPEEARRSRDDSLFAEEEESL